MDGRRPGRRPHRFLPSTDARQLPLLLAGPGSQSVEPFFSRSQNPMTSLKQARAGAIVLAIAACALAGCTRSIVTVPDQGQGAQQIPQGDTPGMIYTIIGNGGIGNGDFKPALEATQYYPMAPFFDEQTKTLYYIDWNNHQIKILSSDGRVESIVDRKGVLGD